MYKDIKKIKRLTGKLKAEGDIAPDEADYIFILRCISRGYYERRLGNERYFGNNFNSYSLRIVWIEGIIEALKEWYEEVYKKIRDSKTGNFMTTVPSGLLCSALNIWGSSRSPETLVCNFIKDIERELWERKDIYYGRSIFHGSPSMEAYISRFKGDLLSPDIISIDNGALMMTSRIGLFDRIFKDANTVELACDNYESITFDLDVFADTTRYTIMLELNIPFIYILHEKNSMTIIYPKEFEGVINEVLNIPDETFQNMSKEYVSKKEPIIKEKDGCKYYNTINKDLMSDFAKAVISRLNLQKVNIEKTNAVTKDIAYLTSKTEQLNSGKDITKEESDYIYTLFKFAQIAEIKAVQNYNQREKEEMKKNSGAMFDAFVKWYKAVSSAIDKGKKGNFLYTIPTNPKFKLNKTGRYIKKCLRSLPKEPSFLMFEKNNPNIPEIKDIDFDVEIFETIGSKVFVLSVNRYGFLERNGIDLSKYKIIFRDSEEKKRPDLLFDHWIDKRDEDERYRWNWCDKVPAIVGKLEVLRVNGIYPVALDNCIAIPTKDMEKAKYVLEVPDSEIEEVVCKMMQHKSQKINKEIKELKDFIHNAPDAVTDEEIKRAAEELLNKIEMKNMLDERSGEIALMTMLEVIPKLANIRKEKEMFVRDSDDWIIFDR